MKKIPLYRYTRPDGGVTVSPSKPSVPCSELFRLVADKGCVLTDGVRNMPAVDTDTPELYSEIQLSD